MAEITKFREKALKHFASPEQLDQLIEVVTPRSWIIGWTLFVILCLIIFWSIFGNVSTYAEGPGVLLAENGGIYNAVAPDGPSKIAVINVKPGDYVTKGKVIATLSRPDLLDNIRVTQNYLTNLQEKLNNLRETSKQETIKRYEELDSQKQSLQRILTTTREKFNHLEKFLILRQAAFNKGIETRQNLEQTLEEYYSVKSEVEGYDEKLIQLDITKADFDDQWRERLRELELKITDEQVKLAMLKKQLMLSSDVISPVNGTVINVRVDVGSIVNTGNPIASIGSGSEGLDALIYLPPKVGKRIKLKMRVLISPTTVEKAEFGSIVGKVIDVALFPATTQAMEAVLQNPALVKEFSEKEAPIEVRVRLFNDPSTFSKLKWTSSEGPKQQITAGTLVTARIIIRDQAPITLLVPTLKKLTGVE